ncbi:hypothetical protein K9M42_02995 [Patescibacteria group bacterium]|nr:hypothetical protein [Patescibacteria group bacterium]
MNKLIIGLSGKKQSGKDDIAKHLKKYLAKNYCNEKDIKIINFADPLKEMCIDKLGLLYNQVYGSNEDKDSFTNYYWEKMPFFIRWKYSKIKFLNIPFVPRKGKITAREILQVVGTDIFRDFFKNDIWINVLFNKLKKIDAKVVMIPDVRFSEEIHRIIDNSGFVIRLSRQIFKDNHWSEKALNHFKFNKFEDCFLLNNSQMNLEEQRTEAEKIINKIITKIHSKSFNKALKSFQKG